MTPTTKEELKEKFEKITTINIDMKPVLMYGKRATDEISNWWLSKLSSTQSEMREEFLRMIEILRKGKVKGEDEIWAAHYLGFDEALDSLKEAVLAKYPQ